MKYVLTFLAGAVFGVVMYNKFVVHGKDGTIIGDSTATIGHLETPPKQ